MAHDEETRSPGLFGRWPRPQPEHDDDRQILHLLQEMSGKLDTLLGRAERTEDSVGRQEAAWQRNEERLMTMPTNEDLQGAVDALRAAAQGAAQAEAQQVIDALAAQAATAQASMDQLNARIDDLTSQLANANLNAVTQATLDAVNAAKDEVTAEIAAIVPDQPAPSPEPTPEPPAPPVEGGRR